MFFWFVESTCDFFFSFFVMTGFHEAQAAFGGGTCTIPTVGTNPGASGTCTGTANGFCLLNHLTVTGSPVTAVNFDGVCICYTGYSGSLCASKYCLLFLREREREREREMEREFTSIFFSNRKTYLFLINEKELEV